MGRGWVIDDGKVNREVGGGVVECCCEGDKMLARVCGEISPVIANLSWQRCSCSACICV